MIKNTSRNLFFSLILSLGAAPSSFAQVTTDPLADAIMSGLPRPDSRLVLAATEFHSQWQLLWISSEDTRLQRVSSTDVAKNRVTFVHCHDDHYNDAVSSDVKYWGNPSPYTRINSRRPVYGICPSWMLSGALYQAGDESVSRDGALLERLRPIAAQRRARLVSQLQASYVNDQSSVWITGQLARLLVDQGGHAQASAFVKTCSSYRWWCEALHGYVAARFGEQLNADSAFTRMRRSMPDSLRHLWEDVGRWLPEEEWSSYLRTSGLPIDSLQERLWWLADPLYREAGNARRVEQDVRNMEIVLRSMTVQDERYSFDAHRGGDALALTIRRYGWPSYVGWSGEKDRRSHTAYLRESFRSQKLPSYTTFEYTTDRVRTLPLPSAVRSPFEASSTDWELLKIDPTTGPKTNWWPVEHYRHSRKLVQLPKGQTVSMRRQSYVDVVSAVSMTHSSMEPNMSFDVLLLSTSGPSKVDSIDQQIVSAGSSAVLRGQISQSPTLLAIEALGVGGGAKAGVDARTRFGYAPLGPLSSLERGSIALSDIAILERVNPELLRSPNDTLLGALLPTTSLSGDSRVVTLYWESYGTTPEDSLEFTLGVESASTAGALRRLGAAVGIASDPTTSVSVRWKDTDGRAGTTTLRGPVTVQMRALTIDLSSLRAGSYTIHIAASLRDGRSVETRANVEILP